MGSSVAALAVQTFVLPDLGEGLAEAEIVRWLVAEGDIVSVDQSVVEVETAKSLVVVPTPYAGRVRTRHATEGTTLEVGKPLITILALDTSPDAEASSAEVETYREEELAGSGNVLIGYGTTHHADGARRRRPKASSGAIAVNVRRGERRVLRVVSPLVRRIAREAGLDLEAVRPSTPGGVIRRADVERAIEASSHARLGPVARGPVTARVAPAIPAASVPLSAHLADGVTRIPMNGFRKALSAALSRSRSEIPEATVWVDVDATALWDLRESARTRDDTGPGLLSYIARFVVAALKRYPVLNAHVDVERQEIVQHERINLGIAVQGKRGLVVPAVIGADAMNTTQLDQEIRRVTTAAREGRVSAEEMAAGTFTLNNYGSFRVDGSAAIINHPQVAILGLGRVIDRPWVIGGELCIRKVTQMSFVFDHRVCDGGEAAGFMRCVADAIENPLSAIERL